MTDNHEQTYKLIEYFLNFLPALESAPSESAPQGAGGDGAPDADSLWLVREIRQFMDEMPGGFFIYRADGAEELVYANRTLLRIFQCDSLQEFRELTGNSFRGVVHPLDLEPVEKSIAEQVADSQYDLDYVEYRIIRKDGVIRWVEDYGHFIHTDRAGDFFYVFLADATEKLLRQQKEKSILIQESRQEARKMEHLIQARDQERSLIDQEHLRRLEVIEGLSMNYEAILYVDLAANTIRPYRLNLRAEQLFVDKLQVRNYDWFIRAYTNAWVHPEDREMIGQALSPDNIRTNLQGKKSYYFNYRILVDGQAQYLQLRVVNVGASDCPAQVIMGYRRVDEEMRHELAQKQMLEVALSSAKQAMNAKNTFLSNMSHDMRTPLNAIFGFAALAKKNLRDPETARYLEQIEEAGHQLLDQINKALELSWMESRDFQLTESACSLPDILRTVWQETLPAAREKGIELTLELPALAHPRVYSDGDRIKQCLEQLIRNAVTFTGAGGSVTIFVSERPGLKHRQAIYEFTVRDSGIGIEPDFLSHIYEPFERGQDTTSSGIPGSGLGLTIVKYIVEKMGGTIHADSTVGEGSTFTVTLPLWLEDPAAQAGSGSSDSLSRLLRQKILLAEDNEINLEIETEMLQDLGLQIETAKNGKEAVERIQASEPGEFGLVLMDIQMPVMNGWDAARAIRALEDPVLSAVPIIALSANAFESDIRTSRQCGINAHLMKPFDIPLLLESVGQIL